MQVLVFHEVPRLFARAPFAHCNVQLAKGKVLVALFNYNPRDVWLPCKSVVG